MGTRIFVNCPLAIVKGAGHLYRDAIVPDTADTSDVERLLAEGYLIEREVDGPLLVVGENDEPDKVLEVVPDPSPEPPVTIPEAPVAPAAPIVPTTLDGYTVEQLRTYAAEQGIDLGKATTKADIRAQIDLALAEQGL